MRDILKKYTELGFHLVPCEPKEKLPIFKEYQKLATTSLETIDKWLEKYPDCNWAILPSKSNHICIDVDVKNHGTIFWDSLQSKIKPFKTFACASGGGGLHYVFKANDGVKYKGKIKKDIGIDTRFNNYFLVEPSVHPSGGLYKVTDWTAPIAMPEDLQEFFKKEKHKTEKESDGDFNSLYDHYKELCAEIKETSFGYDTWLSIGMALHHAFSDERGLELWKFISEGANFKEGDLELCEAKWSGFTKGREDELTIKSLIFIAKELGCTIPSVLKAALRKSEWERVELERAINPGWFKDASNTKDVCVHPDFIVKWVNDQGYAVMQRNPGGKIIQTYTDKQGLLSYEQIPQDGLKLLLKNKFYKTYESTTRGLKAKYTDAFELWGTHPEQKRYTSVEFSPEHVEGALNLWPLLTIKAIPGDVSIFEELIYEAMAGGDKDKGKWLMQWLAHIFQRPQEKPTVVPVIFGDQGTGKGFLFDGIMKKILGPMYYKISTAAVLLEKFNRDQAFKWLTCVDEATWRGNKTEDSMLKSLTGSNTQTIEEKFGGRVEIPNFSRYAILSNNEDAVAIETTNRRYEVFKTNSKYKQNQKFFGPAWFALNELQLANHVYHFLLNFDISDFKPFELQNMGTDSSNARVATEGSVALFWKDFFEENEKGIFIGGKFLPKRQIEMEFENFRKSISSYQRHLSKSVFWQQSSKYMPSLKLPVRKMISENRYRGFEVDPLSLYLEFCSTFKMEVQKDFDPLEFFAPDDFKLNLDF